MHHGSWGWKDWFGVPGLSLLPHLQKRRDWVPLVLIWTALLSSNWLEEISLFWLSLFACKVDKVQPAHPWFVRQMTWDETTHLELFPALHRWCMPYAGVKAPTLSFLRFIWITLQVAREGDLWQRHPSWESSGVTILLVQFYEAILIFKRKSEKEHSFQSQCLSLSSCSTDFIGWMS